MYNEHLKAFYKHNGDNTKNQLRRTYSDKQQSATDWSPEVKSVESILVQTGVSLQNGNNTTNSEGAQFLHRDTVFQAHLRRAGHVVDNVAEAVEFILKREQECS